jgi:hypothetical protein
MILVFIYFAIFIFYSWKDFKRVNVKALEGYKVSLAGTSLQYISKVIRWLGDRMINLSPATAGKINLCDIHHSVTNFANKFINIFF